MAVVCPTDGRCSRRCFFGFARPMWINLRHICANGRLGLRFASVRLINELAVSLTVESLTGSERRPGSWTWASSSKSKNVAQAPLDVRVAATGSRRVQWRTDGHSQGDPARSGVAGVMVSSLTVTEKLDPQFSFSQRHYYFFIIP